MVKVAGDWISASQTQAVMSCLNDAGFQAFFVGGCVRNALFEEPVADVDISTDALPDTVAELAKAAGMKPVMTGYDHGTITIVNDGHPFEVTTFRQDVETTGRHAVVKYSTNMVDDARRRDFTFNALYADATGEVLDPLGGLPDLYARRVRFIGSADTRIREDYLRILRFFRFHAWYGSTAGGLDTEGLAAIAQNIEGLASLSKERVTGEILKLLSAADPSASVGSMEQVGVLGAVLPGAVSRALPILVDQEQQHGIRPDGVRRLAAIADVTAVEQLRLSKADQRRHERLRSRVEDTAGLEELGYRDGEDLAVDVALLRAAFFEAPIVPNFREMIAFGAKQVCPVGAKDLMPEITGRSLGLRLAEIEKAWIASGFETPKAELLGDTASKAPK